MKSGSVHRCTQADSYAVRENQRKAKIAAASEKWLKAQDAFFRAQRIKAEVQDRVHESKQKIQQAPRLEIHHAR